MKTLILLLILLALPISLTWAGDWEVYHFEVLPNSDTIRYVFVKYVYDTMFIRFQDLPADTLIIKQEELPTDTLDTTESKKDTVEYPNVGKTLTYIPPPDSCCDTTGVVDHWEPVTELHDGIVSWIEIEHGVQQVWVDTIAWIKHYKLPLNIDYRPCGDTVDWLEHLIR